MADFGFCKAFDFFFSNGSTEYRLDVWQQQSFSIGITDGVCFGWVHWVEGMSRHSGTSFTTASCPRWDTCNALVRT
jgi:hypothetical protein